MASTLLGSHLDNPQLNFISRNVISTEMTSCFETNVAAKANTGSYWMLIPWHSRRAAKQAQKKFLAQATSQCTFVQKTPPHSHFEEKIHLPEMMASMSE